MTDLIWSPRLEKNIGYVWLPIELAGPGTELEIEGPDGSRADGRTAAIPFLDPTQAGAARLSSAGLGGAVLDARPSRAPSGTRPSRHAMNRAIETTATMIVEIALICGVTPNLIEL